MAVISSEALDWTRHKCTHFVQQSCAQNSSWCRSCCGSLFSGGASVERTQWRRLTGEQLVEVGSSIAKVTCETERELKRWKKEARHTVRARADNRGGRMGGEQTRAMRREHREDTKHNGAEQVVGNMKQIMYVPMLAIHEKSCSKKQGV